MDPDPNLDKNLIRTRPRKFTCRVIVPLREIFAPCVYSVYCTLYTVYCKGRLNRILNPSKKDSKKDPNVNINKKFFFLNCDKPFLCRMNGTETMLKHVKAIKHWRKLGKFFINNQLRETFNPVADPYIPKPKEEEVRVLSF